MISFPENSVKRSEAKYKTVSSLYFQSIIHAVTIKQIKQEEQGINISVLLAVQTSGFKLVW